MGKIDLISFWCIDVEFSKHNWIRAIFIQIYKNRDDLILSQEYSFVNGISL